MTDVEPKAWKYANLMARKKNDRMYSLYLDLVSNRGYTDEAAVEQISDDLDTTPRKMRNLIARRMDIATPGTRAVAESHLLTSIAKLARDCNVACQNCRDELDGIDDAEDGWVDMEKLSVEGGKGDGEERIKRLPKAEARKRVEDRMLEMQSRFLDVIGKMTAKNVINIHNDSGLARASMSELNAQIDELQAKLHIEGGSEIVEKDSDSIGTGGGVGRNGDHGTDLPNG